MFGSIGGAEIVLILVLALLLFGPRKLPQIGRTIGRGLSEFRKATTDLRMNLEREVDLEEVRSTKREVESVASEVRSMSVVREPAGAPARSAGSAEPDPGRSVNPEPSPGTGAPQAAGAPGPDDTPSDDSPDRRT